MFFCAVAGWFVNKEKCDRIASVMDGRLDRREMPFGITKTVWTQNRCLNCKHRFESHSPQREEEPQADE